jgi:hypothetical protein
MVKEISSLENAKTRITTLFKGESRFRLQSDDDINDFARVVWFLTDNNRVKTALEEVSKQVWIRYNLPELRQSPNRFSQAIIKYGTDQFGFSAQTNVVFTGALGGPEFLTYVKAGVLWKDTFAPSHGEFSHSFQWLAAGQSLGLGTRTADLYKKAGSVFSNQTTLATRGETGALERARQPLWAWLVDCFQPGDLDGAIPDDDIYHVFSKKYRVPNMITGLALNKSDWFLGLYVDHRKKWLARLAERGKQLRATAGETAEPDSNLLGIMKYQQTTYPTKTGWTKHTDAPEGAKFTPSGNVLEKTAYTATEKAQTAATFHGIPGTISKREVGTKTLLA